MNFRRRPPLWLIAVILPPIVSAILSAIYDWEANSQRLALASVPAYQGGSLFFDPHVAQP